MRIDSTTTTPPIPIKPKPTVDEQVAAAVKEGYQIASDGPTGIQLVKPKKMTLGDKLCLIFGVLTCWIFGIGLFFILIAALDYWFFTKAKTKFIARA